VNKTLLSLVLALLLATVAQAGTLSPGLQAQLADKNADETISVIVHMTEKAPIAELKAELRAGQATRQQRHGVIVTALQEATRAQDSLLADLAERTRSGGVVGYTSYWIGNLIVVLATPAEIELIAERSDVDLVELNFEAELIEPVKRHAPEAGEDPEIGDRSIGITAGLQAINADRVWYELGITGEGRIVGSLDTGVDGNHPALTDRWRGLTHSWEESWHDVVGSISQFPVDYNDHGTHTTGTMTGVADDDTVGVAWGAQWIAANAIDQGAGGGFTNDIIDCLQWFADPDGDPGTVTDVPDVVCNSWGVNTWMGFPSCYDGWNAVIDNCEAAGVVTVWATGNEGPSGSSVRSPADRATTTTNSFSVGSVNANGAYPYGISGFSSRGPSQCNAPAENLIKPEVSAPGSGVYSSVPGGGYQYFDGTSMATPHVAGVVALMREAAPNIDVDTIKQILMATAHDFGASGEDNAYGWGFIDAYEAVLSAMTYSYGQFTGRVVNGSYGGLPIANAVVTLTRGDETHDSFTDEDGYFTVFAPDGGYSVTVEATGFASGASYVQMTTPTIVTEDFDLVDNTGPIVFDVTQPLTVSEADGAYAISAMAVDHSTVISAALWYRVDGGAWMELAMSMSDDLYNGVIPVQAANSTIDYYVSAVDGAEQVGTAPLDAPQSTYTILVAEELYAYEVEEPADNDWQVGLAGDTATAGAWERVNPVGTTFGGVMIQPEDDHTADPGEICFVTGNGDPGGSATASDIDGGCTTLVSPVFDLTGAETAFAKYWRWYGEAGAVPDDELAVDVSDDGGVTWVEVERVIDVAAEWTQVVADLGQLIDFTDQVMFRFTACDINTSSLVDAAIDDFSILAFTQQTSPVPDGAPRPAVVRLAQNHPNPFNPSTTISFELPRAEQVKLAIYAVNGRRIATLLSDEMVAGPHQVVWNGRDDRGQQMASGTYFYRLQTGSQELTRRMILIK